MPLIDDLVRRAEQELKDLKQELETLSIAENDIQNRIALKQQEEKAARKLYKSLRNQQPTRPGGVNISVPENTVVRTPVQSNGSSPDYQGALELLKEEDKEFTASEFAELANAKTRDAARQQIFKWKNEGLIVVAEEGTKGQKDSTLYKVVK